MSTGNEKLKDYLEKLEPYRYEIGGGILLLIGLFYLIWAVYLIFRAIVARHDGEMAGVMKTELTTEFWKYILTTIGLCLQYGVIASYIMGKIVKNVIIDVHMVNVSTCDSKYKFHTSHESAILYYYVSMLFQVFAMLCASCMLSTFNLVLNYMRNVFYRKVYSTNNIYKAIKLIVLEFIVFFLVSIIGIGIPFALVTLVFFILYKFIRFTMNCKEGYKVYRYRLQEIRDTAELALGEESGDSQERGESIDSECVHYGYIATVFCFGAGFYVAQLAFDPLATVVEASCTIFPMQRYYIRILFHFMNLLVWGSFAMVIIIFVPFFIPYTFYYVCKVLCPTKALDFLSRASNCFRKPPSKILTELNKPLIQNPKENDED